MVRERWLDSMYEKGFSDLAGNEEIDTIPIKLLEECMRGDLIDCLILLSDGIEAKDER